MSSTPNLLEYLRSAPTVSVRNHEVEHAPRYGIRTPQLLLSRGPSFPALVLDTSAEFVEENLNRRTAHARIMAESPAAFRRKKTEDGPTSAMEGIMKMKDLLSTMHPYKDPANIDKSRTYTYSRRTEIAKLEKQTLDEYQFQTMKPMEDFLQPNDLSGPRRTGYESGHIRNVLKLDSYGPGHSRQNTREREMQAGDLPLPNLDRYATQDATNQTRSMRSLRPFSPSSNSSSRASTAQSNSSFGLDSVPDNSNTMRRKFRTSQSSAELRIAPSLRSLYLTKPSAPVELTMPASLRPDTFMPGEQRITEQDRQLYDPFVRRKTYQKNYQQRLKTAADNKRFNDHVHKYVKNQQELANLERKKVREFEKHLSLAKFET